MNAPAPRWLAVFAVTVGIFAIVTLEILPIGCGRFLVGVVIGGFWSIGVGLAPRLVGTAAAGRATSVIFAAVPLGSVLGVPLGTLAGQLAGWRTAFLLLGVLSLATAAALLILMPPLPPSAVFSGLPRRRGVRSGLLVTFLVVLAHIGTCTYLTPLLRDVVRPEAAPSGRPRSGRYDLRGSGRPCSPRW
ncbi:MFS transporter [Amycolatopsis sp. NPDC026612]|uniref:MFS transporter n=1 Tax=Amycolatopsis sp. NPDC026612 TaxID=3155466 RepID=UPI0033EDCBEE